MGPRGHLGAVCVAIALSFSTTPAPAAYPDHPVRLIVGYAPGGGTDIAARILAKALTDKWGQSAIVVNTAGAAGYLAASTVSQAAPDGYTLLVGTADLADINTRSDPSRLFPEDPVNHLAPVILATGIPNMIVVAPSFEAKSLKELIALAKASPGKLNLATGKIADTDTAMAALMRDAGIKFQTIGYPGTGPTIPAIMSGELQVVSGSVSALMTFVRSGDLRALAVTSNIRSSALPDVPTVAEAADLPGFNVGGGWQGILAPPTTPKDIIARIHDDLESALRSPDTRQKLTDFGINVIASTPEQFGKRIADELSQSAALAKK